MYNFHYREYYFSAENLQNDLFLRRNMDAEGFLPLCMVASFPRVQLLTQDTNLIIASLCNSQVVEFNNNGSKVCYSIFLPPMNLEI
jgi:la-related protein 1